MQGKRRDGMRRTLEDLLLLGDRRGHDLQRRALEVIAELAGDNRVLGLDTERGLRRRANLNYYPYGVMVTT